MSNIRRPKIEQPSSPSNFFAEILTGVSKILVIEGDQLIQSEESFGQNLFFYQLSKEKSVCHKTLLKKSLWHNSISFKSSTYFFKRTPECPRTDLDKIFLPLPKTTTAWKLIPQWSKISKIWNPPHWKALHRFFKKWFFLILKQLYSNYIQTHFT